MKLCKAILIDADTRAIKDIELPNDSDWQVLGCDAVDAVMIDGNIMKFHHAVLIDDEGLLKEEDELAVHGPRTKTYFQITMPDGSKSHFLLGKGIVHGFDHHGATVDVRMTAAELAPRVEFTRKRFLGMASGKPESGPVDFMITPIFGEPEEE